jgi:hypothetical protein
VAVNSIGGEVGVRRPALAPMLCCLSFLFLGAVPLQAQESPPDPIQENPPAQTQPFPPVPSEQAGQPERPEISDDPTDLRTSLRGIAEQVRFDNGAILDRLRIRYIQSLGKRDGILGDFPLGRVDPGSGFSSAYGTGDLLLQYVHLFGSSKRSYLQAAGAIGGLKTATNSQLGGHSGLLGALYGIAWRVSPKIQPYLVVQYLHSLREDSANAIQSVLQIHPALSFGIAHGWFATGESRIQEQLYEQRRWGATLQASVGRQVHHWRTLGGYERGIGATSQEVIYRSRVFLEFGYTF